MCLAEICVTFKDCTTNGAPKCSIFTNAESLAGYSFTNLGILRPTTPRRGGAQVLQRTPSLVNKTQIYIVKYATFVGCQKPFRVEELSDYLLTSLSCWGVGGVTVVQWIATRNVTHRWAVDRAPYVWLHSKSRQYIVKYDNFVGIHKMFAVEKLSDKHLRNFPYGSGGGVPVCVEFFLFFSFYPFFVEYLISCIYEVSQKKIHELLITT